MCLAVPLKLVEVQGEYGKVESEGVTLWVNLSLTAGAKVGDYVIVHTGFAISLLDEKDAEITLDLLREYIRKVESDGPPGTP